MRRAKLLLGGGLAALATFTLLFAFFPVDTTTYASHPNPAATMRDAELRIGDWQRLERGKIRPECETIFMSHEVRTERVIVLVHGYTSCPESFRLFGEMLHREGHNVLIAPLPLHGNPDRLTREHEKLTATDLVRYADGVIDAARGLGERVTVAGISAGGVIAAWGAQQRGDVDMAVLISPALGYDAVPVPLTLAAARLFRRLPSRFQWWDQELREAMGPSYSYPQYSHRALAQLLYLSSAVMRDARLNGPASTRIAIVTNASDRMISNAMTAKLVKYWDRATRARITEYEFATDEQLGHDIIDPNIPGARTDLVYAKLLEIMR